MCLIHAKYNRDKSTLNRYLIHKIKIRETAFLLRYNRRNEFFENYGVENQKKMTEYLKVIIKALKPICQQ